MVCRLTSRCSGRGPLRCGIASALPLRVAGHAAERQAVGPTLKGTDDQNVYDSGLNSSDWCALRDVIWPFLHTRVPQAVDFPSVPEHLANHPVVTLMRQFQATGADELLDRAGQYLIPTKDPFGWYVPLTK